MTDPGPLNAASRIYVAGHRGMVGSAILEALHHQGFTETVPTKPINGRVLQVNFDLKPGLVALNVGAEAGVTRGMTFQIYSGSTWKGQVRVENVQPGMSSALILDMKQGETINQGDSAATIL